ncbi:beta-lactamase class C and other penicillin binding proteins [Longilinea arvoryzae]|uniref:Beta-lactamase class C and other penicillin binding proteins n=1 Tax=Longilinea arvoryzae TaxID=360412 RepID=A0A0S7B6R3_9CHLR|nr:serine hydrolase domain-containing protein [Longilinea arvoryzae]GAP12924.1 beta-lactamase class C and other penicillin binding proteins [Longilinea arvoryzae]
MRLESSLQDRIDSYFVDYDTPHTPGCALGLILDGELVYARGYGLADLEQGTPITPDTVFHLASVSKQFTAACIALLEEAGELALEDKVGRYIPYLPEAAQALTLKNLVYMTNGLEDFYSVSNLIRGIPEDEYFSEENAIEIIRAANWLKFSPGASWSYSNTGYFLLGKIVERVSGQSLAQFAGEHIFSPLGMAHTFFRDDRRRIIPHRANGYARAAFFHPGDPTYAEEKRYDHHREPMALPGAGQAWSTVNDLFHWDQNFYHNVLGKGDQRLIERLTTPGHLDDGTPTNYAFGLFVTRAHGCRVISHEGGAPGTNTVIYRVPEKRCSFICLANTNDFIDAQFKKFGPTYYEDLAGTISPWAAVAEADEETRKPIFTGVNLEPASDLSPEQEALRGSYEDAATVFVWEVTPTPAGAVIRENFGQKFPLVRLPDAAPDGAVYSADGRNLRCTFMRDAGVQDGPFTRILVEGAPSCQPGQPARVFQRFFSTPRSMDELHTYAGMYRCAGVRAGYRVIPVETGLRLQNLEPRNDVLNVVFTPTIPDLFMAHYPPALEWYMVHFRRDETGRVASFVFRDEVPGRENWVFEKCADDGGIP